MTAIAPAGRAPRTLGLYMCIYMRATGPVQVAPDWSWTRRPRYQLQVAPKLAVEVVAWPNQVALERTPTRCQNQVALELAQHPTRTLARRYGSAGFGRMVYMPRAPNTRKGERDTPTRLRWWAGAHLMSSGSVRCPV